MSGINAQGPQFTGTSAEDLRTWAVVDRLPWLVGHLSLTAGAICGSLPDAVRREVYGVGECEELPAPIDWERNGIVISPPGTGKGMAVFVEALLHFERVFVLVPSVVQAHKLEESLDALYHPQVAGARTSQRSSAGLVQVLTTGVFNQMVRDRGSDLWKEGSCLIVDEAQRILEEDPETEFMVGFAAARGVRTFIVSATIAAGNLPEVFGTPVDPAAVYSLNKEMHPVDIRVHRGANTDNVLVDLPVLRQHGCTTLVFCASRREVMRIVKKIRDADDHPAIAVGLTGAHVVEDQLREIGRAQQSGGPVVVVATPGTADSSVTIPGLRTVVILDERIRVEPNRFGVMVRRRETLPINHIWQMVRRVGREAREDGLRDAVHIVSREAREDVLAEQPVFTALTGCSPYAPIENLLLEAVSLDVRFEDVHSFMLSTFSSVHIAAAVERLLADGMIVRVDDPNDPDGFEMTEKGALTVSLPFEYNWSRLLVEAPEELQLYLTVAASCGSISAMEMFEREQLDVDDDEVSEVIQRITLGIQYFKIGDDRAQEREARMRGLSFRRLEQGEILFGIACEALEIDWSPRSLCEPGEGMVNWLTEYLVAGGLRCGLYDLYFLGKGKKGGWSECRMVGDEDRPRRFFAGDKSGLDLDAYAEGEVCLVAATPMWFTSQSGAPCANLNDVTIVPEHMVARLVRERADREGWQKLTFKEGDRGDFVARGPNREKYLLSRSDADVEPGREYWCSIDRQISYGVYTVWAHYPVL